CISGADRYTNHHFKLLRSLYQLRRLIVTILFGGVSNRSPKLTYRALYKTWQGINLYCYPHHVLNGGDPGGALMIRSTSGMTYPIATTASMSTIHRPHRSVHLGVGAASSSGSAIGNTVWPLGARNIR